MGMSRTNPRGARRAAMLAVAGALLAPPLPAGAESPSAAPAEAYQCRGNEPFWALDLAGTHGQWRTPEAPKPLPLSGTLQRLDWSRPVLAVWRGDGRRLDGHPGDLVAMISHETCPDTMADRIWPATARLSLPGGAVLLGCCAPGSSLP